MSQFNNPTFNQLKKKWYSKLKDKGFEDAEQDEYNLKAWHSAMFCRDYDETFFRGKEDYYRLAGQFLYDFTFRTAFEKKIWELHSQGISMRNIAKILSKRRKKKLNKDQILPIVQKLVTEMISKCK